MIQKNKPWILTLLSLGIGTEIGLAVLVLTGPHWFVNCLREPSGNALTEWVIACIVADVVYLWGCVLLANARGYSGAVVAGTVVIASIASFWFPLAPMFLPLAVLLSSPDKNRIHSRRRHTAIDLTR